MPRGRSLRRRPERRRPATAEALRLAPTLGFASSTARSDRMALRPVADPVFLGWRKFSERLFESPRLKDRIVSESGSPRGDVTIIPSTTPSNVLQDLASLRERQRSSESAPNAEQDHVCASSARSFATLAASVASSPA